MDRNPSNPAGYAQLIRRYNLAVIPNWHESAVASTGGHRIELASGLVREVYPAKYWPGDNLGDHLEFALKYDGTNLLILAKLFATAPQGEVTAHVRSKPNGKYARRIWYLYEFLTGNRLSIEDVTVGNYVDLLEPDEYYTATGNPIPRQRVRDNLLGNANFCPIVRRTQRLATLESSDLAARCRKIIEGYPVELLRRALAYL